MIKLSFDVLKWKNSLINNLVPFINYYFSVNNNVQF